MIWLVVAAATLMMVTLVVTRVMRERSLLALTPEQKVKLVDAFSRSRILYPLLAVAIVIAFMVALGLGASLPVAYLLGLVLPWLGVLAWSHVAVLKKLRTLEMPERYRQTFHRSRLLVYAGLGVFLAVLVSVLGGTDW